MSNVAYLLDERAKTHGSYARTAQISQDLKEYARRQPEWASKSAKERESIDMAASKWARMVSGDATFPDHMNDIDGYEELAR